MAYMPKRIKRRRVLVIGVGKKLDRLDVRHRVDHLTGDHGPGRRPRL